MKKKISLLICSLLLSSCSNAKNAINEDELDKQILQTKIIAISSSLESASFLYRAAYKNSEKSSEVNDHLYLYALSEIESLFNTYDMGALDYKKDIKSYRLISGDAIDSMCIINKFLKKYQSHLERKELVKRYDTTLNKTFVLQSEYLNLLKNDPDLINGSQCLKLN
ncbi:hypothetical protein [Acinetobacter shaoyimingii]|uniref:Lipoprotein n=1 Tax=Acinetobacter shaoyimingii TaxID=2715164 RepID=A0A6G8RV53_9GAMM|nr:hypothetical protein [Acinetobacter shaoyimingii]NHB58969.1 hypothetical protein [Acinetobacter shaoyimingii]QIO05819.1 hypothetical protein G8E00_07580 [Acinetobacter shaoyimingii]